MRILITVIFLFALMVFSPSITRAQESPPDKPLSKESLDSLEAREDVSVLLNKMYLLLDEIQRKRNYQCLKVFGHSKFCNCINKNMATGLSFWHYVQVLASTKEELDYSNLSEEDQLLVDNALKVREQCVTELGFN